MFSKVALVVVGTIVAVASASRHPINSQIVNKIRTSNSTWVAHDPETNPFRNYPIRKLQSMLGAIIESGDDANFGVFDEVQVRADLPDSFSWTTESNCVHPIMDQAQCGSCWAFAGSEAYSDRMCILRGVPTVFSPQDLVSCDKWNMGCNGGILPWVWSHIKNNGITTQDCISYTSGSGSVGSCPKTCDDGSPIVRYGCDGNVASASGSQAIRSEVFTNGPVETGFTVYEDFFSYKSGVYQYTYGDKLGGHAVKIVGWGVESGLNYWLCANSWGTSFGEEGFFKIAWGQVGIDDKVYACKPSSSPKF